MMIDLPLALACGLFVFAGGVLVGLIARDHINPEEEADAGDTHGHMQWADRQAQPLQGDTSRPPRRLIGGDTLKPSYDARRHPPRQP